MLDKIFDLVFDDFEFHKRSEGSHDANRRWLPPWYNFNLLKLSRLVLVPNTWPILENAPYVLEKNVYSAALK